MEEFFDGLGDERGVMDDLFAQGRLAGQTVEHQPNGAGNGLDLAGLIDRHVDLGDRPGAAAALRLPVMAVR